MFSKYNIYAECIYYIDSIVIVFHQGVFRLLQSSIKARFTSNIADSISLRSRAGNVERSCEVSRSPPNTVVSSCTEC